MAHQYSRAGLNSSVEVNEVNLSLSYGVVVRKNISRPGVEYRFSVRNFLSPKVFNSKLS